MKDNNNNILEWPTGRLDFTPGCLVMGILNVTPDSFSDGGQFLDTERAIDHGIQMAAEGAAIIDIGPESTRPGSKPVGPAEQIKRAIPVIEKLSKEVDIPISIDTYNPQVAKAALEAGAAMINDITALADEQMATLAAEHKIPVILMHMQGAPTTMQTQPQYENVVEDVLTFLLERAKRAQSFGIPKEMIFIDPGIGFGKTVEHNISLLKHIDRFVETGYRVLIGTSRKSFLAKITGRQNPADRIFATAATVTLAATAEVAIARVHDVPEIIDVVKVANKLKIGK